MFSTAGLRGALACAALACFAASPSAAEPGDKNSAEASVYAGIGVLDSYGGVEPDDDMLWGVRIGTFMSPPWSLEFSYQELASENDFGTEVNVQSYRGNLLLNFFPEKRIRPFVTAGIGLESTEVGENDSDDPGLNFGGGIRFFLTEHWALRLDGRAVYTDLGGIVDDEQGMLEGTLGALLAWGGGPPPDTDGDGVRDRKDECPDTPRGALVDEVGCPKDSDGDRVWDGLDACPDTDAGCPVDERGCPLDSDGDAVIDCKDSCQGTPAGCKVDETGCPADADGDRVCDGVDQCDATPAGCTVAATGCPMDADADGVCDGVDRCPGTTKGCKIDATGCPPDEDGDRVCDGLDRCPGTPAGRTVDAQGCEALFERGSLVLEGVAFANDSAELAAGSAATLDAVAASLRNYGDVLIEVAGHTDSRGSSEHNLDLSQRRAQAVKDYLVSRGVDASKLAAMGYGEEQPIADNATENGRARNRRVELKKLN